jgi:hypothetical protein
MDMKQTITITEMRDYLPVHPAHDKEKLEKLVDSMEAKGYQGGPMVAYRQQFVTGAHRYEAANCLDERYDRDEASRTVDSIPVIDLEDVFEEAGLDLYEVLEAENTPDFDDDAFIFVLNALPEQLRDKYGIDLH